jgi:PAS domain S-box-containing protein
VASLLALPAQSAAELGPVVRPVLDTLLDILPLAFVCVRLNDLEGAPSIEVEVAESWAEPARVHDIREMIASSLDDGHLTSTPRVHVVVGDVTLSMAFAPLGVRGDIGTLAAGSLRSDFPTQSDQLLLDVAASQATISLQQARLVRQSDRSSRVLVDSIPGLVALLTAAGEVEFVNRQILEYTGKTLEQMKYWGTDDTVHPEDLPGVIQAFTQAIASGSRYEIVQRLRRADGAYLWFQNNGFPLRDASGNILRWCVLLTDIDERKRAEEALRASALNLRQLTETIPEMLWSARPDGAIEYCNSRFLQYTGFSAEEVMDDGWQKTIHPDDAARVAPVWMSCVATGATYRVEVRTFHAADRTYRWCAVTALPLRDGQGHIVKWHGTIVDMQDWKQEQEELRNTQAALAHVTRMMTVGELTASIAHEVNQPLSGIITNASTCLRMLAAEPPDLNGARETARRTIRDGNRASEVIERLRALFRKHDVTTEAVDLNDAIREVIALSASELQKNQVALRRELADRLPLVTGDRVQLQQVVLNLVMNASEAMRGVDDRRRQLLITTTQDQSDQVLVTVEDTGIGFGPQDIDRLFEAFYTTKSTGMGMGLSVSRSIVERHHGRFWAALNDGPGATFRFSLPVRPSA